MNIAQVLPGFNYGDAISNEARLFHRVFQDKGHDSAIFAEHIQPRARHEARPVEEFFASPPPDLIIYHVGIGTPITARLRQMPGRKVMVYHNITPGGFFHGINAELERLCRWGRLELKGDRATYELVLADSAYNREELVRIGYGRVEVLPIPIDWTEYANRPDEQILAQMASLGGPHLLFVGRISASKRQDDLVRTFYVLSRHYRPSAHLWLIGTAVGQEAYLEYLTALVERLGLKERVHVVGHINFSELLAYYAGSDVFVSMSEHEGVGIPLLEAMYFGKPVVAYGAAAVPETVGAGGLVFRQKDFLGVAELIERVLGDEDLRQRLAAGAREQVDRHRMEPVIARFERLLAPFVPATR